MSVVVRCPRCLTRLPEGARGCAECGTSFRPREDHRAWLVLGAIACAAAAGALAWWARGRQEGLDAAAPEAAVAPRVPAGGDARTEDPSDVGAARQGSAIPAAIPIDPSPGEVDPAPPRPPPPVDLSACAFTLELLDAERSTLRSVTALRLVRPDGIEVLPFAALNGARFIVRRTGPGTEWPTTGELVGQDGLDLAFTERLAPEGTTGATVAAWESLAVGARVVVLDDSGRGGGPESEATIEALEARDGVVTILGAPPCERRWIAAPDGALIGIARRCDGGRAQVVALASALVRLERARPSSLATVAASFFERDAAARRELAAAYAAREQWGAALRCFLDALDLEPALHDELRATLSACVQLALREARLEEDVGGLIPLLERAARAFPREPQVLHALGLAWLDEGDPERALPFLADAAGIAGDHGELAASLLAGYLHAGEAARADRRPADAITHLEAGLLRFREEPRLLKSLGFAYYELGDRARARIVLEKVASLDEAEAAALAPLLAELLPEAATHAGAAAVEIRFAPGSGAIRTTASFADRIEAGAIIDTGATITAVDEALARRLGLDVERPLRRVKVTTANGTIEAPVVRLESVDVQGARVTAVEAVVLPLADAGGTDALIGLNFLEHFDLSLDTRRGVLRLSAR